MRLSIASGSRMPSKALLIAAGSPPDEAEVVMRHCVDANLAGHDSHGIIQIPTYIDRIQVGHIVPGAPWTIVQESPTTTVIDGHWGFGYTVSERAMRLTIDKAVASNVAATTVFRQGHIGRLASYSLMAAKADMIGLITADSGRSSKQVVPFGGREPRIGTNPLSIAIPSDLEGPLFVDMATSAVAAGKIAVAVARGEPVPLGWIVDKDGRGTTDPGALPVVARKGLKLGLLLTILLGLTFTCVQAWEYAHAPFGFKGSIYGSTRHFADIPRLLELYRHGRLPIDRLLGRRYRLAEINDAYRALLGGEFARAVIVAD